MLAQALHDKALSKSIVYRGSTWQREIIQQHRRQTILDVTGAVDWSYNQSQNGKTSVTYSELTNNKTPEIKPTESKNLLENQILSFLKLLEKKINLISVKVDRFEDKSSDSSQTHKEVAAEWNTKGIFYYIQEINN